MQLYRIVFQNIKRRGKNNKIFFKSFMKKKNKNDINLKKNIFFNAGVIQQFF